MNAILLQGALVFVVGISFVACLCCGMSGRCSREERERADAQYLPPSGEVIPFHSTRLRATGSKLSFQAHHNPSRGGNNA